METSSSAPATAHTEGHPDGSASRIPQVFSVAAVSPTDDLVAASRVHVGRPDSLIDLAAGRTLLTVPDFDLIRFSPDGRHVLALGKTHRIARLIAIDTRSLEVVLALAGVSGSPLAWETPRRFLVGETTKWPRFDGGAWDQYLLRIRLNGRVEVATGPVKKRGEENWYPHFVLPAQTS
jgi:hypothetical protein